MSNEPGVVSATIELNLLEPGSPGGLLSLAGSFDRVGYTKLARYLRSCAESMLAAPAAPIERAAGEAGELAALRAEVARLNAIINTPQANDFLRAVSTEAEHQRQRWGSEQDVGKAPADWFWLVGYLAGKALHAQGSGDIGKAEHHMITAAAALKNWHASMFGLTQMQPGIDGEAALASGSPA